MDPTTVFCPNEHCHARGQTGQGNIGIHARQEQRFLCHACPKTFSARTGTGFYRPRTSAETVVLVVTVLAHGCPVQAIVAALGFDERTVADWWARSGRQGQAVQEALVERPRDLGQVQAAAIRVKKQGGSVWMALAMMVQTRLWLGGEVSEQRDMTLIRRCRALARHTLTLRHGMYLIGTVYNFCAPHERVCVAGGKQTPAMAAGGTDHCWSVRALLSLHVPPPRWTPPTQRGRPSHALKRLIERWGYPLSPGHHAPSMTCREGLTTLPWQR
jgi:transposase-like protein